jgi:NAD+ synthase
MELSKEVLKIDPSKVADKITDFIKENMKDQGRSGILIPISGGLDSSVIASLCARAVGKDKVIGLMLPEKHGNPEAEKYGKILADFLGIKTEMIDISRILKDLGAYDFLLSCVPTYRLKGLVVKAYSLIHGANPFAESVKRTDNKYLLKKKSEFYAKPMVRLLVAYKFAEANNLLLIGSDQKSEVVMGLFVKFDNSDLAPMKKLYRSQVLQLAEFLKIPEEIYKRSPSPDIIPGITDKYFDLFGVKPEKVDLVIFGLEHGMEGKDIAEQINLPIEKVLEIKDVIKKSEHLRKPAMAVEF